MSRPKVHYRIRVRPGILQDDKFGIYAVPMNNEAIEYQLAGQIDTLAGASDLAKHFAGFAKHFAGSVRISKALEGISVDKDVEILDTRDVDVDPDISNLAKEKQEGVLRKYMQDNFTPPATFRFRPFARLTETTPRLLSYFTFVVFAFSISFSVPTWIPILGDWIGDRTLDPSQWAKLYPYILLLAVLYVQVRAWRMGLDRASMRDYVLALSLKRGWHREDFRELIVHVADTSRFRWARKLGEWIATWDPDTLPQVRNGLEGKLKEGTNKQEWNRFYPELGPELVDVLVTEDFEARIHSLYYMDKEGNYRPWTMVLYPLMFLVSHRRAIRRMRGLFDDGLEGLLYLGLCSLPGGHDYKLNRAMFPFVAAHRLLVFTIPLLWAFAIEPWRGVLGWLGMGLIIIAVVVPVLVWNYQLLVQHRGLPRGMSFVEIEADLNLIRTI